MPEPTMTTYDDSELPTATSADALSLTIEPLLDRLAPRPRRLSVTVIVAADFAAAVDEARRVGGQDFGPFRASRLGGDVNGKAVPISVDRASAQVIIDANWWTSQSTADAQRVGLLAHELFHPRLDRLRVEDGSTEHLSTTVHTPADGARWSVRNAVDELRCDLVGDSVLKQMFTVQTPLGIQPLPWGLLGAEDTNTYLGATLDAFDHFLDQWASILGRTLTGDQQSLIARQTGNLLTLLAHAEAEARSFDAPGAFAIPEIAEHPMAALLRSTWQQICVAYDQYTGWQTVAANDTAIADAGQEAVLNLWRDFGF